MGIEVGKSTYPKVDATLVGKVDLSWAQLLEELREGSKEFGRNNNQLKERMGRFFAFASELKRSIDSLPPQGRVLSFSGTVHAAARSALRE